MSKTTAVVLPAANATSGRGRSFALTGSADRIAVTIFSTVGLFVTILFVLYLPLRFPDLGALIEHYNQF